MTSYWKRDVVNVFVGIVVAGLQVFVASATDEMGNEHFRLTLPRVDLNYDDEACTGRLLKERYYVFKVEIQYHSSGNNHAEFEVSKCSSNCRTKNDCSTAKTIFFWGKNGPELTLPPQVAFSVGGEDDNPYVILRGRYFRPGVYESATVTLTATTAAPQYIAFPLLIAALGPPIPPGKQHVDAFHDVLKEEEGSCFRFGVRTHALGLMVTAYRTRDGNSVLMGRADPKRPPGFRKINNAVDVAVGDRIVVRCNYNNTRSVDVYFGATQMDEVCKFYLLCFSRVED